MRTFLGPSAALGLCWMAAPGMVMAAAAEPGSHDPVMVDIWQAGFTIAVFVVLVLILSRFAFKPILAVLEKREDLIHESLASAQRDREAAEARLKEYEQKLEQAGAEATAILEEGRENVEAMRQRMEEETRRSGEEMLDQAKREIGIARDTALKAVYDESAELATSLASAVLKRQLSPKEHQRLMMDALQELGQRPGMSN